MSNIQCLFSPTIFCIITDWRTRVRHSFEHERPRISAAGNAWTPKRKPCHQGPASSRETYKFGPVTTGGGGDGYKRRFSRQTAEEGKTAFEFTIFGRTDGDGGPY